jgi:hypothetical protein
LRYQDRFEPCCAVPIISPPPPRTAIPALLQAARIMRLIRVLRLVKLVKLVLLLQSSAFFRRMEALLGSGTLRVSHAARLHRLPAA